MARRVAKAKGSAFFVDALCHPQTVAVVRTRAQFLGIEIVEGDPLTELAGKEPFGALLQYPATDTWSAPALRWKLIRKRRRRSARRSTSFGLVVPSGGASRSRRVGSSSPRGRPHDCRCRGPRQRLGQQEERISRNHGWLLPKTMS
jgi:hypothetical protein